MDGGGSGRNEGGYSNGWLCGSELMLILYWSKDGLYTYTQFNYVSVQCGSPYTVSPRDLDEFPCRPEVDRTKSGHWEGGLVGGARCFTKSQRARKSLFLWPAGVVSPVTFPVSSCGRVCVPTARSHPTQGSTTEAGSRWRPCVFPPPAVSRRMGVVILMVWGAQPADVRAGGRGGAGWGRGSVGQLGGGGKCRGEVRRRGVDEER